MVHGSDLRSTLETRYRIQRYYQQAREQVNQSLWEAISARGNQHNDTVPPHPVEVGSLVWLYLDRVREGYVKQLASVARFFACVVEKIGEYAVKLESAGSAYNIFSGVHVAKIKYVREFPDRPISTKHAYLGTAGPKIVIQMNTKSRGSRICGLAGEQGMTGSCVNS
ncbi:hypothetical protein PHMEG_0007625 [Phytophthora megakarya]|uniref:Uncharacterized protein n=1 Tax=Phytophthora megakarya TaxID=4795 RepID=A0A225WKZ1_9STRA|nr:hypothetical protein PHMEG_0007625 [Phytophthora megakarya]